ncbi:MAG: hypothetical protein GQ574_00570 [Crocinitomix sp.]|nr:hypothetical protein [Crocinitomix sp.]
MSKAHEQIEFEKPELIALPYSFDVYIKIIKNTSPLLEGRSIMQWRGELFLCSVANPENKELTLYRYKKVKSRFTMSDVQEGSFNSLDNFINKKILKAMSHLSVIGFTKNKFYLKNGVTIALLSNEEELASPFYNCEEIIYKKSLWVVYRRK